MELFSVIAKVNAWKTQYIISDWLHTPYQTIFMVIYWIFKISSLFDHYLENSPVKRGGQPHGSDQCGYIHLLYRSDFWFTVVEVEHLCRLGCVGSENIGMCLVWGLENYLSVKATIFVNSGKSFMCISCTSTFNKCKQYILILISCSYVPLALCITMGM